MASEGKNELIKSGRPSAEKLGPLDATSSVDDIVRPTLERVQGTVYQTGQPDIAAEKLIVDAALTDADKQRLVDFISSFEGRGIDAGRVLSANTALSPEQNNQLLEHVLKSSEPEVALDILRNAEHLSPEGIHALSGMISNGWFGPIEEALLNPKNIPHDQLLSFAQRLVQMGETNSFLKILRINKELPDPVRGVLAEGAIAADRYAVLSTLRQVIAGDEFLERKFGAIIDEKIREKSPPLSQIEDKTGEK